VIDGKHRWRAGDERVTCTGSAELELGNIVPGVFTPVLAKHSKSFSLIDCISVGVEELRADAKAGGNLATKGAHARHRQKNRCFVCIDPKTGENVEPTSIARS